MSRLHLSNHQVAHLENILKASDDARTFKRALALLEVSSGETISSVAEKLQITRATIHNWINWYMAKDTFINLSDRDRTGRPSIWNLEIDAHLSDALASDPGEYGYMAVGWTVELLRQHLKTSAGITASADSIRDRIHAKGFVWKRPRYILQPDPERDEKKLGSCEGCAG